MYDGIWFINSAINVNRLSIFSEKERYDHTKKTLESIDKHCPNNIKIIFDMSPNKIEEDYLKDLTESKSVWLVDMGHLDWVKTYSLNGYRSLAETYAFMGMLDWFKEKDFRAKRIYKLSGRYELTDDFILDAPEYKDAFVFATALPSWMSQWKQSKSGVHNLYRLRLWHMDYNLLNTFNEELPNIFTECVDNDIDIEHSYYKQLHNYKVVEVPKIGVKGIIAPSGEVINE